MSDVRAKELGKQLREWRKARGLAAVDVPEELKKLGLELSYSHYTKMEGGARSLASASLDLREGLRHLYRLSISAWEDATGLHVPLDLTGASAGTIAGRLTKPGNATLDSPDLRRNSRSIPLYDLLSAGPEAKAGPSLTTRTSQRRGRAGTSATSFLVTAWLRRYRKDPV